MTSHAPVSPPSGRPWRRAARAAATVALLAGASCDPPGPAARASAAAHADVAPVPARGVRFEHAGPGEVSALVREALERARPAGRTVLVYVGAAWCEPCQYFHRAAERGELDALFPDLTLLEFDLDRDAERLAAAGYVSRMIPLFTVPAPDGRATDRHIEGSIHGAASVREIAPRLSALRATP